VELQCEVTPVSGTPNYFAYETLHRGVHSTATDIWQVKNNNEQLEYVEKRDAVILFYD